MSVKSTKKSVIDSLDGSSIDLYPFIAYLFQDLKELGTSAVDVVHILKRNGFQKGEDVRVVDLGCGKGAVSLAIAKEFGFRVLGIDALPQFIEDAKIDARQEKIDHLCSFTVGDIRKVLQTYHQFDLAILGAVGYIFGDLEKTIQRIKTCIKDDGAILMDDAYVEEDSDFTSKHYLKRSAYERILKRCKMRIADEAVFEKEHMIASNAFIFSQIERRAKELAIQYPERKELLDDYIKRQSIENEILQEKVKCAIVYLKGSI
jgi:ubiquinone/menaquinone biosynthesis C-methylase UbiE